MMRQQGFETEALEVPEEAKEIRKADGFMERKMVVSRN